MALTNEQYNAVTRYYDALRSEDRALYFSRLEELYEKVPGYKALCDSLAEMSVNAVKMRISGDKGYMDISSRLKETEEKLDLLLKENGYPLDYLDDIYHCRDCRDTGYVDGQKCHCFSKAMAELFYNDADKELNVILQDKSIRDFDLDMYPETSDDDNASPRDYARKALADSIKFIENAEKEPVNMLFYGGTGVGKTFLSACIGSELIKKGMSVYYVMAITLKDIFTNSTFGQEEEAGEAAVLMERLYHTDLLIIDDLGTELHNAFTDSQLFALLDRRMIKKQSTIISTNLSLGDIKERYTDRIFSRLFSGFEIYLMMGDDIRLVKAISSHNHK